MLNQTHIVQGDEEDLEGEWGEFTVEEGMEEGEEEMVEVAEEGLDVNGILFGSDHSFLCFIFC